jgi:hypothetical protein
MHSKDFSLKSNNIALCPSVIPLCLSVQVLKILLHRGGTEFHGDFVLNQDAVNSNTGIQ